MQVVFEMNDMKKLLQEFKKNMLQEQSETTKYDDAIAVIKTFMQSPVKEGTPEAEIVSELQNALNFAEQYNKSPGLILGTPEDDVLAQRKISNKFVQQQIQDILSKMGIDVSRISDFINYLNQTTKTPEEMAKADVEMRAKEVSQSEDEGKYEIGSGDIAPLNTNKTISGRASGSSKQNNDLRNRFKPVSGKVT